MSSEHETTPRNEEKESFRPLGEPEDREIGLENQIVMPVHPMRNVFQAGYLSVMANFITIPSGLEPTPRAAIATAVGASLFVLFELQDDRRAAKKASE